MTEDEYENLKSACVTRGARNVSDFARSELLLAVERDHSEVIERLSELQSRMRRMEQLLERGRK
jgi:hypothetical protein